MMVTAGFIIGFDSESGAIAGPMGDLIEDAAIPVAMVGLLSALPNTQLTRRLTSEGRLFEGHDFHADGKGDQCAQGLNFETVRPRRDVYQDFCDVLKRVYDPVVYCNRVERLIGQLKWPGQELKDLSPGDFRNKRGFETLKRIINHDPASRELLSETFKRCYKKNPAAVRQTVTLLALYLHLVPYAREAIAGLERAIAEIDQGTYVMPQRHAKPAVASGSGNMPLAAALMNG